MRPVLLILLSSAATREGAAGLPAGAPGGDTDLEAVLLHRPLQRVHDLPANQDAQVDQQHPTHDDQKLLVLDDLEEEGEEGVEGDEEEEEEEEKEDGRRRIPSL